MPAAAPAPRAMDRPSPSSLLDCQGSPPFDSWSELSKRDLWHNAHTPHLYELVHSLYYDRLVVVRAVHLRRREALFHVDEDGRTLHVWEPFSMIRPAPRPSLNPAAPFLSDRCQSGLGLWAASGDLRTAYLTWCSDTRSIPLSWTGLSNALLRSGLAPAMRWVGPAGHRVKIRIWQGLSLQG